MTNDHRTMWPLRPAVSLMRSMNMASRMALLGAAGLLPLAALLVALQWGAARDVITAVALGAVALSVYLGLAFFHSVSGTLGAIRRAVTRMAEGDFAARIDVHGRDELAAIGHALEALSGRMSETVADIRSNSSVVAQAGSQLASDSRALSERTEIAAVRARSRK